jgi:hypothetical protein
VREQVADRRLAGRSHGPYPHAAGLARARASGAYHSGGPSSPITPTGSPRRRSSHWIGARV